VFHRRKKVMRVWIEVSFWGELFLENQNCSLCVRKQHMLSVWVLLSHVGHPHCPPDSWRITLYCLSHLHTLSIYLLFHPLPSHPVFPSHYTLHSFPVFLSLSISDALSTLPALLWSKIGFPNYIWRVQMQKPLSAIWNFLL